MQATERLERARKQADRRRLTAGWLVLSFAIWDVPLYVLAHTAGKQGDAVGGSLSALGEVFALVTGLMMVLIALGIFAKTLLGHAFGFVAGIAFPLTIATQLSVAPVIGWVYFLLLAHAFVAGPAIIVLLLHPWHVNDDEEFAGAFGLPAVASAAQTQSAGVPSGVSAGMSAAGARVLTPVKLLARGAADVLPAGPTSRSRRRIVWSPLALMLLGGAGAMAVAAGLTNRVSFEQIGYNSPHTVTSLICMIVSLALWAVFMVFCTRRND